MLPDFDPAGNLPPGIHPATWREFEERFAMTAHRRALANGLREALRALHRAGCRRAYIDGSFVTAKEVPNDFDACWETVNVNVGFLDPVLLDFTARRAAQKAKYRGELFPASVPADAKGNAFFEFFQTDRSTGARKGIVELDLNEVVQ